MLSVSAAGAGSFSLFVTQSPPGPLNGDPATWQGVLHYHAADSGSELTPETAVPKEAVADPAGLGFRASTHEVFVGNRHGNNRNSSISRFRFDFATRNLVPNGTITGNGLYGVHQLAFNPVSGEMFAANVNSGVSRFTFDAQDNPVAHGIIGNGPARGVAVSPDGRRLYVTMGINDTIRQFDLATGAELPSVKVPTGIGGLHYLRIHRGDLYVAALSDDRVYRYHLDAANNLVLLGYLPMNDPADVDFSPDGQEMFVTGHRSSDLIYRFRLNADAATWAEVSALDSGSSLGAVLVIPDAPHLAIALHPPSGGVVLTWPFNARDWILESTPALAPTASWTSLAAPRETNLLSILATVAKTNAAAFFRLKAPPGQ